MRQYTVRIITVLVAELAVIGTVMPAYAQRDKVDIQPSFVCYEAKRGQEFGAPSGVFFYKKRGEIYVADAGTHQILIFDKKGSSSGGFVHTVDGREGTSRVPGEPRGVAVNSRGDIFVTDNLATYVDLLDYRGRSIRRIYPADYLNLSREKVSAPELTVDSDDNLYLAVAGDESCVLVLDKNLKLIRKIGKKGSGKGEFESASGVWVDHDGKVYVTDAMGTALQVFNKDGKFLFGLGDKGFGPMSFGLPAGSVTDKQGNIWVLDGTQCKIAVFDSKGSWLNTFGGIGSGPGQLFYPSYITGNGVDTIYVSEKVGKRIQCLKILFKDDKPSAAESAQ